MQHSRKQLLIKSLLCFCNFWALFPIQAAVHYDPIAVQQLGQLAAEWMNQFGQSAVVLNPPISKYDLCSGYGELLLPLHQRKQQLLLTQLGLQHDAWQTTYHIGVGQRHLTRSPGYWGYNLFYDYLSPGNHSRLSLGLEWHGAQGMIRLNGYLPFSNWRLNAENTLQSRPAEGIDLQLQRTICQQPHLRGQLLLTHYFSRSLVQKTEPQSSPKASTAIIGIDYAPIPLFSAGYGYRISNGGLRSHQVQFSLIYRLGVPLAQQFAPHQIINAYSLNNSHFELINRQTQMVLQQRAAPMASAAKSGESEVSEEPKDISQISTPEPQSVASEQLIPDQETPPSRIASQPGSTTSDGPKLKTPTTENSVDSESSHREDFNLQRTFTEPVSTTTSSEELPVNNRDNIDHVYTVYDIDVEDTNEFLNNHLEQYRKLFEKTKIKNSKKTSSITPNTEDIDYNKIEYDTLVNVDNIDSDKFIKIVFTRKLTKRKGSIKDYEIGVILNNSLNCRTKFPGIYGDKLD